MRRTAQKLTHVREKSEHLSFQIIEHNFVLKIFLVNMKCHKVTPPLRHPGSTAAPGGGDPADQGV